MRILSYVLTRRRVFIFALLGAYFFAELHITVAAIFAGLAVMFALRIASRPDLNRKLFLRGEKKRHGVTRKLSRGEKDEVLALDSYTNALREAGVSAELLREPLEHAWRLIQRSGQNDAKNDLRAFRETLPALVSDAPESAKKTSDGRDLQERLRREVALINAAEREIRNLDAR